MPCRARHSCRTIFRAAAGAFFLAAVASAQSHKVSGPLAHAPGSLGGDVREMRFSADGSRVVYLADQDSVGAVDLYSAPADGSSAPIRLDPHHPYGGIPTYQISSSVARVVFPDFESLLSAPLDGSAPPVELTPSQWSYQVTPDGTHVVWVDGNALSIGPIDGGAPPLVLDSGGGGEVVLSPDGKRAVLRTASCTPYPCKHGLVSLPLDGSQPVISLLPLGPSEIAFKITPDSQRIVFYASIADGSGGQDNALYSLPIDGSAPPTKLSATLPAGFVAFEVSPNSERVVYFYFSNGNYGIHSAPVDGSAAPVQLSGVLVPGGSIPEDASHRSFQITPDGTRVLYRADQLVDQRFEVFGVPIGGGPVTRLSGAMVAGGSVFDFQVSPDSIGVVFSADRLVDGRVDLFAAPFSGGIFQLTNLGANAVVLDFRFSPDDAYVVYRAEAGNVDELFSVPITGGASTKLSGTLVTGGDVRYGSALVSPDSSRVAYLADQETDGVIELFGAPIAGAGSSVRLNAPLDPGPPSGDVTRHALTPDSSTAVFIADGDQEDVFELYAAPVAGGSRVKLSGPLAAGSDVLDLRLVPDGTRVLYRVQDDHGSSKLYDAPLDGGQAPVDLSQSSGSVGAYDVTPDGTRALYLAAFAGQKLFSVPVGGGTPIQLNPGHNVADTGFRISADGARVVFRTVLDLYSAPSDGNQAAVQLNARFGPGSGGGLGALLGSSYQISADGRRVVYVSDATVAQRYELYSVPSDGIGDSARLNAPLPPGGDILQFEISPTGERVVYCADQEVDGRYELYSVPIEGVAHLRRADGSPIPRRIKLNGALTAGGIVGHGCCFDESFTLSPDGSRVAFAAQTVDTGHRNLFVAPLDGSSPALQLSATHVDVSQIRFDAGGERVLYRAGKLYSVRADGSEPELQLFAAGSSGSTSYSLAPDGRWVVYRADLDRAGEFELYARPIDGSQSAIQLNGPLVSEGDIGGTGGDSVAPAWRIAPDSLHVLYGADQEFDEVFELYASPLPSLP